MKLLNNKVMPDKYLKYLGLVVIGIVIFLAGLFLGRNIFTTPKAPAPSLNTIQINPLFSAYTASFYGKIIQVNPDRTIEVENSTLQRGKIKLAEEVKIFDLTKPGKATTPTTDINRLTLNLPVNITLGFKNNEYQATSITYLPNVPSN